MLVSLNWLKNYVDISDVTPEQLAEKITRSGIEVDHVQYIAEKSSNIVVGYVESCEKHPNADKLNLCQVDVGTEKLQIICGAPNIAQGQKVVVAKPGAILPGNFKIKKAKLRGVESNGMICSLQELGMEDKYVPKEYAEGIFIFPDDVEVGEDVEPLLNLNDAVLEFDLTPNRADCLSMLGVAYEVAAILEQEIQLPSEEIHPVTEQAKDYVAVEVDAKDLNPYYGAFIIQNVKIKPSPLWMQNYLMAAGIRPINNVVDITNYVLLEYGQPLHAFDYDRLATKKIVVRRAKENETMVTLDDVERKLTTDQLVITNGEEPVALAGVMGGANTEVHDGTHNILLEAAYFDPTTVRKAVKATGLRSESSTRFEKGVDPNRVRKAGLRACALIETYADGKVLQGVVEVDALDKVEQTVEMDTESINKRLGTTISSEEIAQILKRLRFDFEQNRDHFIVTVPTRRGDITIFEDMLEEVARIYGYDKVPYTFPSHFSQPGRLTEAQRLKRAINRYLQGAGMMETVTYALTNKQFATTLVSADVRYEQPNPISVSMPMSEDHQYLRLSILPELLKTLSYNIARNETSLAYYELGPVFISSEETLTKQPHEQLRVAGALTGNMLEHEWQKEVKKVDFYVVKGIVEGLFQQLNLPVAFKQAVLEDMHPGRCAEILLEDKVIGYIGQLHPHFEKSLDLKETYVFDINVEKILASYLHVPAYTAIPKYPAVSRDVAFILDEDTQAGQIEERIKELGAPLVKHVHVFDVYQGEHLTDGKKSVAYNLVYQDPEKTLKDDEVEASFQEIIEKINAEFHAYVRS